MSDEMTFWVERIYDIINTQHTHLHTHKLHLHEQHLPPFRCGASGASGARVNQIGKL